MAATPTLHLRAFDIAEPVMEEVTRKVPGEKQAGKKRGATGEDQAPPSERPKKKIVDPDKARVSEEDF